MSEIKSIKIPNVKSYRVGEKMLHILEKKMFEISEIKDNSFEFNNSLHLEFEIHAKTEKGGNVHYAKIINCPVLIEYF